MWPLVPVALAAELPAAQDPALAEYWSRRLRSTSALVEDWSVLRDGLVLDARGFATELGDDATARRVRRRARRWEAVGVVAGVLGAGFAGVVLGPPVVVGDPEALGEAFAVSLLTSGPVLLFSGGAFVIGTRTRHAPVRAFYDAGEVDALVSGYNRALAHELGLDPAVVGE